MSKQRIGRGETRRSWKYAARIVACIFFISGVYVSFSESYVPQHVQIVNAREKLHTQFGTEGLPPDFSLVLTPEEQKEHDKLEDLAYKSLLDTGIRCSFLSIFQGTLLAVFGWVSVVVAMLGWWFFLDRVQDLSQAIRGDRSLQ